MPKMPWSVTKEKEIMGEGKSQQQEAVGGTLFYFIKLCGLGGVSVCACVCVCVSECVTHNVSPLKNIHFPPCVTLNRLLKKKKKNQTIWLLCIVTNLSNTAYKHTWCLHPANVPIHTCTLSVSLSYFEILPTPLIMWAWERGRMMSTTYVLYMLPWTFIFFSFLYALNWCAHGFVCMRESEKKVAAELIPEHWCVRVPGYSLEVLLRGCERDDG